MSSSTFFIAIFAEAYSSCTRHFSGFLLCIRVLLAKGKAEMNDYRFLLTGGVSLEDPPAKPEEWIPERCWGELFRLSRIHERYEGFHEKFAEESGLWKQIYDA